MDLLPDDVLLEVFSYFRPQLLATKFAFVSHRWKRLAFSPILWSRLQLNIEDLSRCATELHSVLTKVALGLKYVSLKVKFNLSPTVESALPELPHLNKLELSYDGHLFPAIPEFLTRICPSVSFCSFGNCDELNDYGLMKLIKGWPNLRYLDISHCFSLTESGLINMLYHSTDLNYLNINGIPSVTDRVVQILAERHSKSLKGVWLDGRQLSDSAILTITKKIPLLTEVSISNTIELSAGSIDHFRSLTSLKSLHLGQVNHATVFDELFSQAQFSQILFLSLHHCLCVTDFTIDCLTTKIFSLCGLMNITSLILDCINQTNLPNLKVLDLRKCVQIEARKAQKFVPHFNGLTVRHWNNSAIMNCNGKLHNMNFQETEDLAQSFGGYCCYRQFD